jgi:hypothetical protein
MRVELPDRRRNIDDRSARIILLVARAGKTRGAARHLVRPRSRFVHEKPRTSIPLIKRSPLTDKGYTNGRRRLWERGCGHVRLFDSLAAQSSKAVFTDPTQSCSVGAATFALAQRLHNSTNDVRKSGSMTSSASSPLFRA